MDGQLEAVRQDIGSVKNEIIKTKQDLAAAEQAGNKEKERVLWDLLLSLNNQLSGLNNQLSGLQEEKNILLRSQAPSTAAGQRAFSVHVASSDEDIDAVDAETDETPVRSFKVSRSHQGKLFLDGIEKALANRGLVLLGIGQDGFPAHKDGWTMTTYNTSPVQLIVAPKPGVRFKQAVAYPTQQTILKQIWQSIVA